MVLLVLRHSVPDATPTCRPEEERWGLSGGREAQKVFRVLLKRLSLAGKPTCPNVPVFPPCGRKHNFSYVLVKDVCVRRKPWPWLSHCTFLSLTLNFQYSAIYFYGAHFFLAKCWIAQCPRSRSALVKLLAVQPVLTHMLSHQGQPQTQNRCKIITTMWSPLKKCQHIVQQQHSQTKRNRKHWDQD